MAQDFIPDSEFQPDPVPVTAAGGAKPSSDDFIPDTEFVSDESKYGSPLEQAKTAAEGVGKGLLGPLFTGAETAILGNEEEQRGREAANPITHGAAEVAGFVGPAIASAGTTAAARAGIGGAAKAASVISKAAEFTQAGVLGKAGEAVSAATGLAKPGASFISQVAADTVRGAFEGALYQGGDELSKEFQNTPDHSAETAIANIGMAAVMGGVFGGAIGAGLRATGLHGTPDALPAAESFISEVDRPAFEAGDFKATIENSNVLKPDEKQSIIAGLAKEKSDAPEIRAAAKRLDAPVLEGMIADSKLVQKAEDELINAPPTYSGMKRQALYSDAYKRGADAVDTALGEGSKYSKAELGKIFKTSISEQIAEQNEPIAALYDHIKQYHEQIPLSEKSAPAIIRNIEELKELRISPKSPEGQLASRVIGELENLKTVDDVKTYKAMLSRSLSPTASSGEKRMAGILSDKLTDLEESSIERFAKKMITEKPPTATGAEGAATDVGGLAKFKSQMEELSNRSKTITDLIDQRKLANSKYAEFIGKVQTLSKQLGKGRVYGVQDALNFIEHLDPEIVTNKLFSKGKSEFLSFFAKEFPDQMELMRQYQKGVLREAASRTGELSPKVLFNNINKLEPEIQKSIFSPQELSKLQDAETYLRSFPKNFNPSGTSHVSAMREFFEHPVKALTGNARDLALEQFIKKMGPKSAEVTAATALAKATIKGDNAIGKAVKAVFEPAKTAAASELGSNVVSITSKRDKLDKLVADAQKDPQKLFGMGDSNPVPQYAQAFSSASARAVQYLGAIRPNTTPKSPLDPKMPPNQIQKSVYNRALDLANQPLLAVRAIKNGTLTPQDIQTVKTIYPSLYSKLSQKLTDAMINHVSKGDTVPYTQRLQLALFLGQPLDSTMTPGAIMAAQPKPQQSQNQPSDGASGKPPAASSVKGLGKMAEMARTPGQSRAAARAADKG